MKQREEVQDDFLKDLMKKTSLESPSDDFTKNIMGRVETMPVYQPQKKQFFLFIKSALPWIIIVVAFVLFFLFYDLPYGKYLPGGPFLQDVLLPTFSSFFSSFKELASSKFYSIALVVLVCGGGLFSLERLVSHRISANRHYLI
ncbi:MAG: hypothetical protein IH596_01185 [Bacteroidales bacterium]|nr:hypothetical protein [Bacteroidales bacterium]